MRVLSFELWIFGCNGGGGFDGKVRGRLGRKGAGIATPTFDCQRIVRWRMLGMRGLRTVNRLPGHCAVTARLQNSLWHHDSM